MSQQPIKPIGQHGYVIALGLQHELRAEKTVPKSDCVASWRPAGSPKPER